MSVMRDITNLQALLDLKLDTQNGEVLKDQLADAEAWSGWVAERAGSYKQIMKERVGQHMTKIQDKETVDMMKARVERVTARETREYEDYKELLQIIRDRISLGQSLLRNMRSEIEAGLR